MSGAIAAESLRSAAFCRGVLRLTRMSGDFHDLSQVFAAVLSELHAVIPYDWASIRLTPANAQTTDPEFEIAAECGLAIESVELDAAARTMFTSPASRYYECGTNNADLDAVLQAHALQCLATAPISIACDTRGVIALASADAGDLRPDDLPFLESFAGMLSMMASTLRSRDALQRQADAADRLLEIGRAIAQAEKTHDLINVTTRALASVLDASIAIYIFADDDLQLRSVTASERTNPERAEFKAELILQGADSPVAEALALVGTAGAAPAIHVDVRQDDRYAALRDLDCGDIVVAPLEVDGCAIGAVAAMRSREELESAVASPSSLDLPELLPLCSLYVTPAIQNALLQHEFRSFVRENQAVRRINQVAWQSTSIEESVSLVARTLSLLFDADMVVLVETRGEMATWYQTYGSVVPGERSGMLRLANPWYREKVQALDEIIVRELGTDPPIPASDFPFLHEEGLVSFMAVPFRILQDTLGTVIIGFRSKRAISSTDIRFARSLTHGVAATLMIRRLQTELIDKDATPSPSR